jgi:tripartite-type tricarboxylate transporter receptor subunit TctC
MAEAGVRGFDWQTWAAIVAPVGTPKPVIDRLNAEVVKAVNAPDVRDKLIAQGLDPIGSPPEAVTQRTQEGLKRMSAVVKRAGITAD